MALKGFQSWPVRGGGLAGSGRKLNGRINCDRTRSRDSPSGVHETNGHVRYITAICIPGEVSPGFPHQCYKKWVVLKLARGPEYLMVTHQWPAWRVPMNPIGNPSPYSPSTLMRTSPNLRRAATPTLPAHRPSISPSNNHLPQGNRLPSFGVTCDSACTHKSKAAFAEGTRGSGTRFAIRPHAVAAQLVND